MLYFNPGYSYNIVKVNNNSEIKLQCDQLMKINNDFK